MHKVSRGYQTQLDANEITLWRNHDHRFCGTARVRLDNLAFNTLGTPDHKKVSRLKQIFALQGCLRLKPANHVKALISEEQLRDALRSSRCTEDQLSRPPNAFPVELIFPLDFELPCLYGQHRIAAAKEVLSSRNSWWCVDLYTQGVEHDLRNELIEHFANEAPPSDGEIYCRIEHYKREDNESEQRRWWARLSPKKQTYLRQFHRSPLYGIFNRLLRFDGLCLGINIGTMHKAVALHVEEEINRYVDHIDTVWTTILGSERGSVADRDTVTAVQSRVPKMCTDDREWLEDQMKSHYIFRSVTDADARDQLLRNLLLIDVLIPSFHTLFKDLNYLSLPRKVIAPLLPLRLKHSVYETLGGLYRRGHSFERSYKELWLGAMRDWPSMTVERPRQGRRRPRSSGAGCSTSWEDFSRFTESIGFSRSGIVDSNPETPSGMESVSISFTTSGKGVPVRQRCGIPFQDSQDIDKKTLFFDAILGPVGEPGAGITWLFVRRCFFIAFFGTSDDTPLDVGPTAPENSGHIQYPETALVPFSGDDIAMEDIARPAAETSAAWQTTDLVQHSGTALFPVSSINISAERTAAAAGMNEDNVIHFLNHKGVPLGYQLLCGDEVLDKEEVKRKALRFFHPQVHSLYVQNRTVSPENAFSAAKVHSPPERIYVVPNSSVNVFLRVRQWDAHSRSETRAQQALVNPQESADGDVSEGSEL